jgi:hypothetical protein
VSLLDPSESEEAITTRYCCIPQAERSLSTSEIVSCQPISARSIVTATVMATAAVEVPNE